MKKRLAVFAILWMAFSAVAIAQSPAVKNKCSDPDINTVDDFGPEIASEARSFVMELQRAVRSDDRNTVASMMHYPLLTTKLKVRTTAEFLRNYDKLWSASIKKALLTQSIPCLSYASSGFTPENGSQTAFMIGPNGEIWFDAIGKNDPMKVITINN